MNTIQNHRFAHSTYENLGHFGCNKEGVFWLVVVFVGAKREVIIISEEEKSRFLEKVRGVCSVVVCVCERERVWVMSMRDSNVMK